MEPRILALIPARGGSKGLPGKNIKPMLGKPLICWTIEQAQRSHFIHKIIVSTDSEEIARISRQCGAEVPFLRPSSLATDETKSIDVILHTLEFLESEGDFFQLLILLEPTSPLRDIEDIDRSIHILLSHPTAQSIVSVAKCESFHPEFIVSVNQNGFIRKLGDGSDFTVVPRQQLSNYYYFEGSLYISHIPPLKEKRTFYHDMTLPYIVKKHQAPEVDDLCDFICIEALMKAKIEGIL